MPIEESALPRFPDACAQQASHDFQWRSRRLSTPGSSVGLQKQSRPYWVTDLSGCQMTEKQKDELLALIYFLGGEAGVVLMRISVFCEGGRILSRDANGDPDSVEPSVIGTGDGSEQSFQLKTQLVLPGFTVPDYTIRKPYIDYPTVYGLATTIGGPVPWEPMPEISLYANGTFLPRSEWTVDKETGIVTTDATGELGWTGGFMIPMIFPNSCPISNVGSGIFEISGSVSLREFIGEDI